MKRLFIDFEICARCKDCGITCSYFYHPDNNGIIPLWETANFALVCRRCDDAPCVNSCPFTALEKQEEKLLKRYSMRCTSCKTCVQACPFGTIYPETIPYIFWRCDACVGRLAKGESPLCVTSCKHDGIQYGDFDDDEKLRHYRLTDAIVVHSVHWKRNGAQEAKKG